MLLEVKDLQIAFHDHSRPETVVHDFNLTMEAGEIVGIVGESGSGKSMSAMAIAGLLSRHDMTKEGKCLFQGVDTLRCSRQELRKLQGNEMGIIFQEPMTSLNPLKKIGWQVEESLRLHTDLGKAERKKRALQALAEAELPNPERVYSLYPHNLSGGMRQRVGIAMGMTYQPRLLLADEPTSALDVTTQAQIVRQFMDLRDEYGTSIIIVTHDLGVASYMGDKIVVMRNGEIVDQGDRDHMLNHSQNDYTNMLLDAVPSLGGRRYV